MAAKAHHHSRRSRRLRRVRKAVCGWLLVQLAHTLTTVLLMVVAHWLNLPMPGGE
jgi:hypothetical protein